MSVFRQTKLMALIDLHGRGCHYCKRPTRLRISGEDRQDDATLDHKVPKSKGGDNSDENLLLACRACNHAKGDRSYEDFIDYPHPLVKSTARTRRRTSRSGYLPKPEVVKATREADKMLRWSLAAMIEKGEIAPNGEYRKAPMDMKLKPLKPARKMTALETAQWLRESGKQNGKPWRLA